MIPKICGKQPSKKSNDPIAKIHFISYVNKFNLCFTLYFTFLLLVCHDIGIAQGYLWQIQWSKGTLKHSCFKNVLRAFHFS